MYVRVKANKFHSSKGKKKKKKPSNAFKEYIQNEIHTEVLTYAMKTICNCCSFFSSRKYPNLVLVLSYFNL